MRDLTRDLELDPAKAVDRIAEALREQLGTVLQRRGLVVAMSGGVDSSVCAALAVRAVGPGQACSGCSSRSAKATPPAAAPPSDWADQLGIRTPPRTSRRSSRPPAATGAANDAIRRVVPEFGDDWGCKLVLPGGPDSTADRINVTYIVVQPPRGEAAPGATPGGRVPGDRRGVELQAAGPQDARVLPRRPAALRGHGHAQPAGVRSGVLREGRRRARRREADRPPLQDPGLSARRTISACPRRSPPARRRPTPIRCRRPRRSSTSRCRRARSTCVLYAKNEAPRARGRRAAAPDCRSRKWSTPTPTSSRSGRPRATCTSARSWSKPVTSAGRRTAEPR